MVWGFYEEFITLNESLNNLKEQFNGEIYIINNNLFDQYYFLDIDTNIKSLLMDYFNSEEFEITSDIEAYTKLYSNGVKYNDQDMAFSFINRHDDEGIEVVDFIDKAELIYSTKDSAYKTISVKDYRFELFKDSLQKGTIMEKIQLMIENEEDKVKIIPVTSISSYLNINLPVCRNNKFNEMYLEDTNKYLPILQKYWGKESTFRTLNFYRNPDESNEILELSQGQIIIDIINQSEKVLNGDNDYSDIFITSPTGSGKSLLFQIPAIHLASSENKALTIVITPLIALMQDQVLKLVEEYGVDFVTYINSSEEQHQTLAEQLPKLENDNLTTKKWMNLLKRIELCDREGIAQQSETAQLIVDDMNILSTETFNGDEELMEKFWEVRKSPEASADLGLYPINERILLFLDQALFYAELK